MDKLFDRFGELLRSFFSLETDYRNDPDWRRAWEELDEYLKTGRNRQKQRFQHQENRSWAAPPGADSSLRKDYDNLEVPFGAPFTEVRRSYKHLLKTYHPDHFDEDPEKQRLATQITQKINESFQRIKEYNRK
ncbi:hypothetical protein ES703_107950 [subsurface metagenome]